MSISDRILSVRQEGGVEPEGFTNVKHPRKVSEGGRAAMSEGLSGDNPACGLI